MKALFVFLLFLAPGLVSLSPADVFAASQKANWDRATAMETIRQADTLELLKPLFRLAHAGENEQLLEALNALDSDAKIPAPARDYVFFRFASGLADLEPHSINSKVLDRLDSYVPAALVPHEEHPRYAVPLYNVRGAAAGVRHAWARQDAAERSAGLLSAPPEAWLGAYLGANAAERRGFIDALETATAEQASGIGRIAVTDLPSKPELTAVTARTALQSGDLGLLKQTIAGGSGPDLSRILEAVSSDLSYEESFELLNHCLAVDSGSKAALAITHLARPHLDEPAMRRLMFQTLADPNLGSTSALVLGSSRDASIQAELQEIAEKRSGLAAKRARIAIASRTINGEEKL